MARTGRVAMVLLTPGLLHLHVHLQHRGPAVDYVGLAAAAAASWLGVPGPGEPVLVAAAVLAAKHDLSLAPVVAVAWVAATAGGIIGWLIGLKAGRRVLTAPGPLHGLRARTLERGEGVFARHPVIAIVMTPSWVAGVLRVRAGVYHPVNALAAAAWATGIGVGGYVIGPPVLDLFGDAGTGMTIVVVAVVVVSVAIEVARRHRKSRGERPGPPSGRDR